MLHSLVPWRRAHPRVARVDLYDELDRVFDGFWRGFGLPASSQAPRVLAPRMDVTETENEYRVEAELPGLEQKDIQVTLENGVLTLAGERKEEREEEDEKRGFMHRESFRGRFERSLALPENADEKGVTATYKNGVLTLAIPKRPVAKPEVRTIEVKTS
ncbi:MAG TPA: Hsp20/alpha crystallin family protein [Myxococcota bacterium]|nr:Hsp20/alpha crystallin family protein [Myxococcota bacterium]